LALAGLLFGNAAVLTILFPVFLLHGAAEVGAVHLHHAGQLALHLLRADGLAQLVRQDERRLVLYQPIWLGRLLTH